MDDPLRQRLQHITESGSDWSLMIAALDRDFHHSIREVHPAPRGRYNCFAFALGLHQSRDYLEVAAHSKPNVFANAAFVLHLIREGLVCQTSAPTPGVKLILYFRHGTPKHGGLLKDGRVTSKWGDGKFFEHELYEIPATYGCETRCYDLASPSRIASEFLSYAAHRPRRHSP
jgi:hypothetical protein